MARVRIGMEELLEGQPSLIRGRRLGVLAHPASVAPSGLRHLVDVLRDHGADLRVLLGPEHGVLGEAQDMEAVSDAANPWGLPTYSLYGASFASLRPPPETLSDIDALVVDLQDVGARYYTFIYTLALCMEACASAGVEVIVLDRPNPLGGELVEGPVVSDGFRSFVGLHPLANRHGLTVGEFAAWVHGEHGVGAPPTVIPMAGWSRATSYDDTGLPWVLPSPNMPTLETALVYPGMCLVEGTELSEGRGTTRPFELFGAPWVDAYRLGDALNGLELGGVRFRPCYFKPTFQKHAGRRCGGVQLHVTDRAAFRPYRTGVACLWAARRLWPNEFRWRERAYEFVTDRPAIDLLAGSARLRQQLEQGVALGEIVESWQSEEAAFRRGRQPYLRYD